MALACAEPTVEVSSSTDTDSYSLGPFTPDANALLVCFVGATDTLAAGSMSGGGLTWTRQATHTIAGAHSVYIFTAPTGASPGSCTPTFSCAGDAATGCFMAIQQWTGTNLEVVQTAASEGTETTPDHVFSSALNTNNGYSGGIFFTPTRPTLTEPASWTKTADAGHNVPACQGAMAYRVNGETGTSVAWTADEEGEWGLAAIEVTEGDEPPPEVDESLMGTYSVGGMNRVTRVVGY